eukprot:s5558_g1.t1
MPWDIVPSYSNIVGFNLSMVVPDLLHCWNLGLARDLLGCALKQILSERVVFDAPSIPDRLKLASESLRAFAKRKRYPLRIKKPTKSKLCWGRRKYPSLAASGYDAFVVGVWLEDLLSSHSQTYPEICTMLWRVSTELSKDFSCLPLRMNEPSGAGDSSAMYTFSEVWKCSKVKLGPSSFSSTQSKAAFGNDRRVKVFGERQQVFTVASKSCISPLTIVELDAVVEEVHRHAKGF